MAGGIAEAFFGMPDNYKVEALKRLDQPMRQIVTDFQEFCREYAQQV